MLCHYAAVEFAQPDRVRHERIDRSNQSANFVVVAEHGLNADTGHEVTAVCMFQRFNSLCGAGSAWFPQLADFGIEAAYGEPEKDLAAIIEKILAQRFDHAQVWLGDDQDLVAGPKRLCRVWSIVAGRLE